MSTFLRLVRLFQPYRGWMLLGTLLSGVTLLANVGLLAVSGWFITAMGVAGVAGVGMNYFTPAALIRLAAIVRTAGRYGERLVTHEATFRILAQLRVWFYEKIEPLAPAVLGQYHSGDVLSRIRADIDTLNNVYLRLLVPMWVAAIASVVFVGVMGWFHPLLAVWEASLLCVAGLGVPWLVYRWSASAGQQSIYTLAALRTAVISDVQGMRELQVYGAAAAHTQKLQALSHQLTQQQRRLNQLNGIAQGAVGLCANSAMLGVLVVAIPLVNAQQLDAPLLTALTLFALASFEAIAPLPLAVQSVGETMAAAKRIFALADAQPMVYEPTMPRSLKLPLTFEFNSVSFRYHPDAPWSVSDVCFTLAPAQMLAIVGESGSGKSTLTHLMLRFYEVTQGSILLNQYPIQEYASETIRKYLAVAPQQTYLFNSRIRDNLQLAQPDADQVALETVCKIALIHEFISSQPDGYDTWVGEAGVRLSGGQTKRLALARALLKSAPVLILDEPTEGLDAPTAQQLMQNVLTHAKQHQQSVLLITHQRYGLSEMDTIVYL